jgi:uncharacterized membrane protein YqiK
VESDQGAAAVRGIRAKWVDGVAAVRVASDDDEARLAAGQFAFRDRDEVA